MPDNRNMHPGHSRPVPEHRDAGTSQPKHTSWFGLGVRVGCGVLALRCFGAGMCLPWMYVLVAISWHCVALGLVWGCLGGMVWLRGTGIVVL